MSKRFIALLAIIMLVMFGSAVLFSQKSPAPLRPTAKPGDYFSLIGKSAPDFSLNDQNGKTFRLSEHKGKKVVLFFNEGLMCYPACWDQMASLGADKQLNSSRVTSVSIVTDKRSSWDGAIKKMPELVSGKVLYDQNRDVSTMYGVLSLPSSMHSGNMPGHTYILVDEDGVIRYTKDDPAMGIRNQELITELNKI